MGKTKAKSGALATLKGQGLVEPCSTGVYNEISTVYQASCALFRFMDDAILCRIANTEDDGRNYQPDWTVVHRGIGKQSGERFNLDKPKAEDPGGSKTRGKQKGENAKGSGNMASIL